VQSTFNASLPVRLGYYVSKLFTSQLRKGQDYSSLMPTITICFLKGIMFHEVDAPHSQFSLCDLELGLRLTDRLQVHLIELPKYNFEGVSIAAANDLDQWAYFLNRAFVLEAEELKRLLPQPEFVKATGVVEMIAKTPNQREQYERRLKAELDLRSFVNDARRGGIAEGIAEGKAEGLAEGEAKGRKMGLVSQAKLLQTLLHDPVAPNEELMSLDESELGRLCGELAGRLQSRMPESPQ
jgi:predicted transposase/invertase (TIGR01784 family)